ncbi:MAG: hypothetical protein R3E89_18855 [Thiolinea sp.]
MLFGDQAYLQAPLTFDRQTVRTLLNESAIGLAGSARRLACDWSGTEAVGDRPEKNRC